MHDSSSSNDAALQTNNYTCTEICTFLPVSCLWNQFFFLGHLSFIEIDWPIWIQLIQNSGWKIANSKVVAPGHTFVMWKGNYSDRTPHEFQLISLLPIRQAWSVIVKTEVQWGQRRSYLSASALSPNLYIFHILRMRLSKILAGNILWTTCVIVLIISTQTHPLALAKKETTRSSELVIFLSPPRPGDETPNHRLHFTSCRKASLPPSRDELSVYTLLGIGGIL